MGDECPKPSPLERDIESARRWLWQVGRQASIRADEHNDAVDLLVDKVVVIAFLMELPGDGPLRVRLFPNVFNLQA
jgi:hypothetical protein